MPRDQMGRALSLATLVGCLGVTGASQAQSLREQVQNMPKYSANTTHTINYQNTGGTVILLKVLNQGLSVYVRPGGQATLRTQPFTAREVDSTAYYRVVLSAENNAEYCSSVVSTAFNHRTGTFSCAGSVVSGACQIRVRSTHANGAGCDYTASYTGPVR